MITRGGKRSLLLSLVGIKGGPSGVGELKPFRKNMLGEAVMGVDSVRRSGRRILQKSGARGSSTGGGMGEHQGY